MSPLSRCCTSAAPVIETLLGVQFSPLARFRWPTSACTGPGFPASIRIRRSSRRWCSCSTSVDEQRPAGAPALGRQLVSEPEARRWLIDASATQLVRIQRDRFIRKLAQGSRGRPVSAACPPGSRGRPSARRGGRAAGNPASGRAQPRAQRSRRRGAAPSVPDLVGGSVPETGAIR
jgi:hypothetical protein